VGTVQFYCNVSFELFNYNCVLLDLFCVKRSKVKEIIVLIKARSFLDELNLEHLTS